MTTYAVSATWCCKFDADRGFSDYLSLVEELEALLHRHLDLLLARSLSPHFRPFIETEARPV